MAEVRMSFWAAWVVASQLAIACTGSSQAVGPDDEPYEYRSDRAYLRLPATFTGGEVEVSSQAPALLQCYEADAGSPDALGMVQLELVFEGGSLRPRFSQEQRDLSGNFTSCVERIVIDWDLSADVVEEGAIVPLEFGPLE